MNKFIIIGLVGFISYYLIVSRMVNNAVNTALTNAKDIGISDKDLTNMGIDLTAKIYSSNPIILFWWYGSIIMLVIGIIIFIKNLNK